MQGKGAGQPSSRTFVLGAFGEAGHLFPLIALGKELHRRGHHVYLQSWRRWREAIEGEGLSFLPAPEHRARQGGTVALPFYDAAARAVPPTVAQLEAVGAEVVVADTLTLAPALAAERLGLPWATFIPHPYPRWERGLPPFSLGARPPHTPFGRLLWRSFGFAARAALAKGREDLNRARQAVGLPPKRGFEGGESPLLTLVGTFPQLEYPRPWPTSVKVVGPLIWEPPTAPVADPPGEGPLVLVAPSTSQDPHHRLLQAAVRGLAGAPCRVLATWNGRPPKEPLGPLPNGTLLPWLSYRETMTRAALVICHGGHGTVARALSLGKPVLACPVAGDMFENALRLLYAGVGLRLPRRFIAPRPLRRAALYALANPALQAGARSLSRWYWENRPTQRAATLLEEAFCGPRPPLPAGPLPVWKGHR